MRERIGVAKCSRLSGRTGYAFRRVGGVGWGGVGWEQLGDRELLLYRVRVGGRVSGWVVRNT